MNQQSPIIRGLLYALVQVFIMYLGRCLFLAQMSAEQVPVAIVIALFAIATVVLLLFVYDHQGNMERKAVMHSVELSRDMAASKWTKPEYTQVVADRLDRQGYSSGETTD